MNRTLITSSSHSKKHGKHSKRNKRGLAKKSPLAKLPQSPFKSSQPALTTSLLRLAPPHSQQIPTTQQQPRLIEFSEPRSVDQFLSYLTTITTSSVLPASPLQRSDQSLSYPVPSIKAIKTSKRGFKKRLASLYSDSITHALPSPSPCLNSSNTSPNSHHIASSVKTLIKQHKKRLFRRKAHIMSLLTQQSASISTINTTPSFGALNTHRKASSKQRKSSTNRKLTALQPITAQQHHAFLTAASHNTSHLITSHSTALDTTSPLTDQLSSTTRFTPSYRPSKPQHSHHRTSTTFRSSTPTLAPKKEKKSSQSDDEVGGQYQRMSQREHILLRPEPYIGSSECVTDRTWVLTKPLSEGEDGQVVDVDFNFIPGLYKIFDEILVNAADNVHRNTDGQNASSGKAKGAKKATKSGDQQTVKMTYIDIKINPMTNCFSIENDGASIPVVMHPTEKIYVPELIFGHLLTSSNYDDTVARFTGGRHGYGAKLTNIFSKKFIVTIADVDRGVIYRQKFSENMSKIHSAHLIDINTGVVTDIDGKRVDAGSDPELKHSVRELMGRKSHNNFTRIEFFPDLERFQVDRLTFLPTGGATAGEAAQEGVKSGSRSLQKKQLSEVLSSKKTTTDVPGVGNGTTDNDFTISLHKSDELNQLLQSDPYGGFPPFLLPLFERRVLDVASLMGNFEVDVSYNGKKLKTKTYLKYLEKCPSFPQPSKTAKKTSDTALGGGNGSGRDDDDDELIDEGDQDKLTGSVVTQWLDNHWFVGVSQRPQFHNTQSGSQSLNQLSFVNSVATTRGGTHVHYINDIIARYIVSYLNTPARKKKYGLEQDVTIGTVKQFMCVFISCYIHNPSFDTQTKDTLITHIKGPQTVNPSKSATVVAPFLPEAFLRNICSQTGIVQNIILSLQQRQHKQLMRKLDTPRSQKRSGGLSIEKLDDALWAGTDRSTECTLILTEGDSAKALAVSGLSVLGRERFGVYPLKGKLLNVRDVSKSTIANNKELVEIMQILGLKMGASERDALRYGSVLVMADQDHDGSHIKGLLVNAMHMLCPDLVKQQIHETSAYPSTDGGGGNDDPNTNELMIKHYEKNLPDNLKLNTSQHHFIRLFVTPIVKATFTGADFPVLALQRNLKYQQELLDFQAKFGHLSPKQLDQLNATRKMLYQSRKDNQSALSGGDKANIVDAEFETISPPLQYHTTLTFSKTPQADLDAVHHATKHPHKPQAKHQTDGLPAKRINDSITVRGKVVSFYSQFAYKMWWDNLPPAIQRKFHCKYYKGLGTSTSAEGKEYFSDLPSHIIDLLHRSRHDDQAINLAFSKDAVDGRKSWVMTNSSIPPSDEYINTYNKRGAYKSPSPSSDIDDRHIASRYLANRYTTINEFIHNELVQFSVADTIRSLPSVLDGFKPSQRKITFAALNKPLSNELRVSQFAAYVSEKLVYHHGEQSLTAAIVTLAQDYPGTNNIPLLTGVGQFGTRHNGGKDHASARYIYTKLGPLTTELFPHADTAVLPQQTEEGSVIEPIHLLPILPLMLINGASGIGTGFSTDIPAHNPMHVFQAVVQWLKGEPMRMIAPFSIGMTSQLHPLAIQKFDQTAHNIAGELPTVHSVDLAGEVSMPKIDAPWPVIPLHDTTDITKTYPYDNSYGINDVVQYAINRKKPSELLNSNELDTSGVLFTIDNKPIINQQILQIQKTLKKAKLASGHFGDDFMPSQLTDSEISSDSLSDPSTDSESMSPSELESPSENSEPETESEDDVGKVKVNTSSHTSNENPLDKIKALQQKLAELQSSTARMQNQARHSPPTPHTPQQSPPRPASPQQPAPQFVKHVPPAFDYKAKPTSPSSTRPTPSPPHDQPQLPNSPPKLAQFHPKQSSSKSFFPPASKPASFVQKPQTSKSPPHQSSGGRGDSYNGPIPPLDHSYLNRSDVSVTKWTSVGKYYLDGTSKRTLHIVELPYGVPTNTYKKFLLSLLASNQTDSSADELVVDRIEERHTEQHVWFTVHCQQASLNKFNHDRLLQKLRLTGSVALTNMHGFGSENNLHGWSDVRVPLAEYCVQRLKCYERRRVVQITEKWRQLSLSSNIARFCSMIMSGELSLTNKSKVELLRALKKAGFQKYDQIYPKDSPTSSVLSEKEMNNVNKAVNKAKKGDIFGTSISTPNDLMDALSDYEDDAESENGSDRGQDDAFFIDAKDPGYDYLLKIPMLSATKEKVSQLEKQMKVLQSQVASLVHTTAKQMWLHELSLLQPKLEQYVEKRHNQALKHPFMTHPSYRANLDGTVVLNMNVTDFDVQKPPKSRSASSPAKSKAPKVDDPDQPKPKRSVSSVKKSTTRKATGAKKAAARKSTAAKKTTKKSPKKSTSTRKKTTANTANEEPLHVEWSNTGAIHLPAQSRPKKPAVIPSVYNDDDFVPGQF